MTDEVEEIGLCCILGCRVPIYSSDSYFRCEKDTCGAIMCVECMLNEESHPHPMEPVKGILQELVHFSFKDKKTGNTLFLGEYATAIPGSKTIKAHKIRSVLSIMEFDDPNLEGVKDLRKVFYNGSSYNQVGHHERTVYHHVNIPDYRDPQKLALTNYSLSHLFCETATFIDQRLKEGNVLIHCHMGQRRSPTVLIAWLTTRKFTPEKAIDYINAHYTSEKDWAKGYRKERSKWISKLHIWKQKHPQMRKFWRHNSEELMEKWRNEVVFEGEEDDEEEEAVKAEGDEEEGAETGMEVEEDPEQERRRGTRKKYQTREKFVMPEGDSESEDDEFEPEAEAEKPKDAKKRLASSESESEDEDMLFLAQKKREREEEDLEEPEDEEMKPIEETKKKNKKSEVEEEEGSLSFSQSEEDAEPKKAATPTKTKTPEKTPEKSAQKPADPSPSKSDKEIENVDSNVPQKPKYALKKKEGEEKKISEFFNSGEKKRKINLAEGGPEQKKRKIDLRAK